MSYETSPPIEKGPLGNHTGRTRMAMALAARPDVIEQLVEYSERALSDMARSGLARGELVFTGPRSVTASARHLLDGNGEKHCSTIVIPAFEFDIGGAMQPAFRTSPSGAIMDDDISSALRQAAPQVIARLSDNGITVSNTAYSRLSVSISVEWLSAKDEETSRKGAAMPGGLDALVAGVPPEDIIA